MKPSLGDIVALFSLLSLFSLFESVLGICFGNGRLYSNSPECSGFGVGLKTGPIRHDNTTSPPYPINLGLFCSNRGLMRTMAESDEQPLYHHTGGENEPTTTMVMVETGGSSSGSSSSSSSSSGIIGSGSASKSNNNNKDKRAIPELPPSTEEDRTCFNQK
jgi:hypothetical protein